MNPISKNNMKYNSISNIKIYREFESSVNQLQQNQKDKLCNLLAVLKVILAPHNSGLSNQNSNSSNFKSNIDFTGKWQFDLENINEAVALIFGRDKYNDTEIKSYTNIILSCFKLENGLFNKKMLYSSYAQETLKPMQILSNENTIKTIEKALDDNLKTKLDNISFNNLLAVLGNKLSSLELSNVDFSGLELDNKITFHNCKLTNAHFTNKETIAEFTNQSKKMEKQIQDISEEYYAKITREVLTKREKDTQDSNPSPLNNVTSKDNDSIAVNFEEIPEIKAPNNSDIEPSFGDTSELENLVLLLESNDSQDNRLNIPANLNNKPKSINPEQNKEESFVYIENKEESFVSDENQLLLHLSSLHKNSKIKNNLSINKINESSFILLE